MDNESIYKNMISDLALKLAKSQVEIAELNALLEQAQKHINNLTKEKEGAKEHEVTSTK